MSIKDDLQRRFEALQPQQKTLAIRAAILCGGIVVCAIAYYGSGQSKKNIPPEQHTVAVVKVGENRLEDDVRAQVEQQKAEQEKANKETKDKLDEQGQRDKEMQKRLEEIASAMQKLQGSGASLADAQASEGPAAAKDAGSPQWPKSWAPGGVGGAPAVPAVVAEPPKPELVGSIGALQAPADNSGDKKKGNKRYYLPVSFMPAKLLTGLKAKTIQNAQNDPEPMMLRVQAPAVLPNEVRAELKGCFVIANGFGSLASERIEARLVSLSCVDYDDQTVINADIKGILVDKDGTKGLAGHVVWRAGASIAWTMISGAFQGAGQALSQSSTQVGVSPLGSTAVIQPDSVGKAAAGQALASGSAEMTKIFSDLVKQAAPVVEHGPDSDCGVVLTEGVWLEVKPYETDGASS